MTSSSVATPVAHRRFALVLLCFVQFMLVLDDTVVSVALPSVREDLGFTGADLPWVVNAYFLAFGGLLLLFGRGADLWGRRRVFLIGVAVFGLASLVCGAAQEPWQLVAGRFVQGAGAAMASPAALSLITRLYSEADERAKALGVWGGIAGLGGTMGLVISGILTDFLDWRWIFWINLPIAALTVLLLHRVTGESRAEERTRLDIRGALTATGAVGLVVYGLLRAGETGWNDVVVGGAIAVGAVLAGIFVVNELRTTNPLVPLSFMKSRVRLVANVASLLFSAAFFAMAFLLMIHIQTVLGYRPFEAAVAYLPFGGGILVGIWLSARAVIRLGVRWTITMSFAISAVGLLLLALAAGADSYLTGLLPGLVVTSVGCGLGHPALAVAAVTGTTNEDAGLGSAILTSVQQIGGAVGLSVLVTVAARYTAAVADTVGSRDAAIAGFSLAIVIAAGLLVLGAILTASLLRTGPSTARTAEPVRS
ncbi:EmrB/QacA subfamily drug resistance transporter [Stackebrandtia endophytica]|uniref:EmrB/QacA subfamily drug resistance transporter n=1 Tax=Stackebrandtia endophytica TaxID=1496996 RepID=A0A543AVT5_9ACTN|nr:MFS transporter [Stackebrandtia endophytica]TQL76680.1 EmrB/QacA subfamily drug resistance transporter [Stackebrandtia endophytica]